MRAFLVCLLLFFAPLPAQAGPWPREAQAWFVSTTAGLERAGSGWRRFGDVHAEYGLSARLTLATQLRHAGSGWRGDLLARWHPQPAGFALPFGLSAGARLDQAGSESVLLLLGAHLGRGFDMRHGNLWTRLDLQVQTRAAQPANPVEVSLSGQVGFRSDRGLLGLLSLRQQRRNGTTTVELSPAIGHDIGRAHTLVLGLTASPSRRGVSSAQLSLWSRF